MASTKWAWEPKTARYRSKKSGRFMSPTTEAKIRDDFNRRRLKDVDAHSRKLANGKVTVKQWEVDMRRTIEQHWTVQYMHGRGGRNAMTREDRAKLRELVRGQWDYLRRFAVDVSTGRLSAAQIKARARLYLNDSTRAHSEGRASAHGVSLPAHPGDGSTICKANCVISGTIVEASDLRRGYRRWYEGDVFTLTTEQGRVLTVTPNHPILTERGWIAARQVNRGDHCFHIDYLSAPDGGNPNVENGPTPAEQVFELLAVAGGAGERMVGSGMQFHGDGRPYGDVDVIATDRVLTDVGDSVDGQDGGKNGLPGADRLVLAKHTCPGSRGEYAVAIAHAAPGPLSVRDQRLSFLCAHELKALDVRLGLSAWIYSALQQARSNIATTNAVFNAQAELAHAGNVEIDTISDISIGQWSGYVYNLETESGYYQAGEIIVHNCRCHWEIQADEQQFKAYWRRQDAESCPDCRRRARTWAPLIIQRTEPQTDTDTGRMVA